MNPDYIYNQIYNQDFAEMRGRHTPLRTRIRFLKTDILFAQICTKYSLTVVITVYLRSAYVVALRVCCLVIMGVRMLTIKFFSI